MNRIGGGGDVVVDGVTIDIGCDAGVAVVVVVGDAVIAVVVVVGEFGCGVCAAGVVRVVCAFRV